MIRCMSLPQMGIVSSSFVELPEPIFVFAWILNKYVFPGKSPVIEPDELPGGKSLVIVEVEPYLNETVKFPTL